MENLLLKKLGYSKDTKLLIIHADDLGLTHSQNKASIKAMENGMVNSGSIMVTCPWFTEIANYANKNPDIDFGIHLTLTSEWDYYKWGPVLPVKEVPTLVDKYGFFLREEDFHTFNLNEVENELCAQIDKALKFGIKPTHLDSHMFCMYDLPEFMDLYIKIGKKYNLPLLLDKKYYTNFCSKRNIEITEEDILVDAIHMAVPDNITNGIDSYYINILKSMEPGLNVLLLHPAFNTMEMEGVTNGKKEWGTEWRQKDFDFFTCNLCKKLIEEEKINLITWRQLHEKNKLAIVNNDR